MMCLLLLLAVQRHFVVVVAATPPTPFRSLTLSCMYYLLSHAQCTSNNKISHKYFFPCQSVRLFVYILIWWLHFLRIIHNATLFFCCVFKTPINCNFYTISMLWSNSWHIVYLLLCIWYDMICALCNTMHEGAIFIRLLPLDALSILCIAFNFK